MDNQQESAQAAPNLSGNSEHTRITWHTAFYAAIQLSFINYLDVLDFEIERHLTREPLRIDLVIIKKKKDVVIEKNIASIFKARNIVEYKGPDTSLSIADYHKVMAYAHLYCTPPENTDMDDLTVTFVCSREPRELKAYLREKRYCRLTEKWPGITVIEGEGMPMQILERQKLPAEDELWLATLDRNLSREQVKVVLNEAKKASKRALIGAYLYMLVKGNTATVREVMRMSDLAVFEEVFKGFGILEKYKAEGVAEGIAKGKAEGVAEGIAKGEIKGIAEGETRGIAKGETRGEEKRAIKTARLMKADNEPIDKIVRYTGLTEQQIAEL